MKISFNWLKSLINIDINVEETAALLTASGLEVEGIEKFESVPGGFNGLVVGHILKCEKHPDADRLHVTQVDIGAGQILNIVCGAPNVSANQKVIVATVGTKLYPTKGEPFEIKKSKIRGAASEGMICAEDEIGLGESHAGIMILPDETPIGLPASDYFKIENDTILEIGLTPNRSDATSHYGVARDLAAILNCTKKVSDYTASLSVQSNLGEASNLNKITIKVEDQAACKRYSGLVISGIQVKESPNWLQNRLKSIGIRPINNIVDITNFVLHEMGQPLHAFDYEKIKGQTVVVRRAKENEDFTTLDGIKRKLRNSDLVIANNSEPMCLAGVFGGAESGINESTTSIFLESAYFDASSIRSSSRHHGLKTDASFRFERGTDPEITVNALLRASHLIFELAGGQLSMDVVDIYPEKLEPYQVAFSFQNCNNLIGKVIDNNTTKNILSNLGIKISKEGNDGLLLSVPRYKTDVTREVDVIEEVMRIYGYNHIEVSKEISYTASHSGRNFDLELENKIGQLFENNGFNEMMNLSLSKETNFNPENLVKVLSPLSQDLNALRADLLPSGLESIAYNLNRKNADLKLFEIGRTYQLASGEELKYIETKQVSIFMCGNLFAENPFQLNQKTDFSSLKSIVISILSKLGIANYKTTESTYSHFEYGLTFTLNNKILVEAGLVKLKTLKSFDISQPVFYANLNWEVLVKAFSKQFIQFEELNKFPSVRRDLALLLDKSVKYQDLVDTAFGAERKLLKEVNLFDIFESEKLGDKKSYALSFTLSNSESTLTDKQIETVMAKLIQQYQEKFQAEIR